MTGDDRILGAGIHEHVPAAVYHADPCPAPSLSASIAQRICLSSPFHAFWCHPRLNPHASRVEAEEFDIGTAAHALLLEGDASRVTVVEAKDWRTAAARDARDEAYAAGRVPILARRWVDVQAMVATARAQLDLHQDGGAGMFRDGEPEQTLIWQESDGVWCRSRLDYLRAVRTDPDTVAIDDYKTTSGSANPEAWARAMFYMGADIQAAFYLRAVECLTDFRRAMFRFAVQETFPPYALAVIALGPDALVLAEKKVRYALDVWHQALTTNTWSGYPARTCYATLPPHIESAWLEKELRS